MFNVVTMKAYSYCQNNYNNAFYFKYRGQIIVFHRISIWPLLKSKPHHYNSMTKNKHMLWCKHNKSMKVLLIQVVVYIISQFSPCMTPPQFKIHKCYDVNCTKTVVLSK